MSLGWRHEKFQARKPYDLGLKVPLGIGNEIPLCGIGRRSGFTVSRIIARNSAEPRNDDLRWVNQCVFWLIWAPILGELLLRLNQNGCSNGVRICNQPLSCATTYWS